MNSRLRIKCGEYRGAATVDNEEDKEPIDPEIPANTRRWLRNQVHGVDPVLNSHLSELERLGDLFYIGEDYDPDYSDIDEMGPY